MSKPKAPPPPDPRQTAAASTSTNVSTAIANANLGNVNQVTPDGSLTYSQSGTFKQYDPYTGKTYDIPQFTATQQLSASGQATKDQTDAAQFNLGKIANDQSAFLGDYLNKPVDLNNEATEGRLMELGMKRLQPLLDQRRASNETDLINRGIRPGSTNYGQAQDTLNQGENDAFNQLLLTGRNQSVQEQLTERNQPINEISALLSGSQVSQPNFVNANMPTIPTTDVAGIINSNYQQQLAASQAGNQNILGGLFGLGASFLGNPALMTPSDRRLKRSVRRVGMLDNGLPVYSYRYVWGGPVQIGVMADEVETIHPEAVVTRPDGIKMVNYEMATEAA